MIERGEKYGNKREETRGREQWRDRKERKIAKKRGKNKKKEVYKFSAKRVKQGWRFRGTLDHFPKS